MKRTLPAPLISLLAALLAPVVPAQTPARPQTAQAVIARIIQATGAASIPNTIDTIKAGDPETTVTGIVTTFMDTYEVLQKAVAAGDNLIITHEPTFYNHLDDRTLFPNDSVIAAKLRYIEQHHLVVWRFHDYWHARSPDGILEGEIAALGWSRYRIQPAHPDHSANGPATGSQSDPEAPHLFHLPPTSVAALATQLRARTGSPVVRVVGDPSTPVTNAALLPGASGLHHQVTLLERTDVQVLVAGESAEWEAVEYVRDAAALARTGTASGDLKASPKALILLGHEPSEEAGMSECATWLRTILPGTKIDFIPAGSPFTLVATPQP